MELLSIFYALLAAVTGFGGADRAAAPAPVAVAAGTLAQHNARAECVPAVAALPYHRIAAQSATWPPLTDRSLRWAIAPAARGMAFVIATFANRRE